MASTNLPSKLSRAICNYLVSEQVVPFDRAYPCTTRRKRTLDGGPIITVDVWPGNPEPILTGNDSFTVSLVIKGSAVKHPEDTNDETERIAFDAMVGAARDALMQTDDNQTLFYTVRAINTAAYTMPVAVDNSPAALQFAANNVDMADFAILHLYDFTYGQGKCEDCDWEIALQFKVTACENAEAKP